MMSPENNTNLASLRQLTGENWTLLTTLVGVQTVLSVTIVISVLVLTLCIRKKLRFLQNLIKTVSLFLTKEEIIGEEICKDCGETDKIEDTAAINHVINEESETEFKEVDEMTKPKQTRKMCKSDSGLSIRNKAVIKTKQKSNQKEQTAYEKCRLPFENGKD